jgi:hypothetical protein
MIAQHIEQAVRAVADRAAEGRDQVVIADCLDVGGILRRDTGSRV